MNERLELAIADYRDGTLDATGAQLLVEALRGSDAAAVRERISFDSLLGQAFIDDGAVERSVRERIEGERSASAVVRAVRGSLATTRRQRHSTATAWLPRLAVAALLLVVIGAGWWLGGRASPRASECRIETNIPLTIARGNTTISSASGSPLFAGDRFRATTRATLVWPDGSRVVLEPEAQVELSRPTLGPGCRLEQGTATAEIAPQRPGLPFTIATPEARIEVLGTRFQVVSGAQRTQVDLHEGIVRLTRGSDGRALTMHANDCALVAAGEDFVVRHSASVTPTTAATTPEPAWVPLFAVTGLDGWEQQHGVWSNVHGVVRGSDPHHGKARLLGRHPFADLDLTCRLRITDAKVAELQVGNYNWFVEVPANGTEWVHIELHQRAEHLTISADGVALKLHPGEGASALHPGPLAFYIMSGGTLEISEAKYRVPPIGTSTTR